MPGFVAAGVGFFKMLARRIASVAQMPPWGATPRHANQSPFFMARQNAYLRRAGFLLLFADADLERTTAFLPFVFFRLATTRLRPPYFAS